MVSLLYPRKKRWVTDEGKQKRSLNGTRPRNAWSVKRTHKALGLKEAPGATHQSAVSAQKGFGHFSTAFLSTHFLEVGPEFLNSQPGMMGAFEFSHDKSLPTRREGNFSSCLTERHSRVRPEGRWKWQECFRSIPAAGHSWWKLRVFPGGEGRGQGRSVYICWGKSSTWAGRGGAGFQGCRTGGAEALLLPTRPHPAQSRTHRKAGKGKLSPLSPEAMEASSLSPEICKSNVEARGGMRRPTEASQLPDEVLEQILSWVPARALVARCSLVCRRWRDLLGRPTLWKRQWERDPDHRGALEAAQRHRGMDWVRVSVLRPLGRNLLKNPCGKEQAKHWRTRLSKSQCFLLRPSRFPGDSQKDPPRLTTCDRLFSKTQVIDLLKEGFWEDLLDTCQPDILISDCWEDRRSTGCQYSIQITLLAADQTSIITEFKFQLDSTKHQDTAGQKEICHVFRNYGPGVRYVRFWHEVQDSESWMACFGVQLTNSVVMAKISQ